MIALAPTGRLIEGAARVYRRTFRGSVMSTFLNPVLFLLAMGVGLGKLVDSGSGGSTLPVDYPAVRTAIAGPRDSWGTRTRCAPG